MSVWFLAAAVSACAAAMASHDSARRVVPRAMLPESHAQPTAQVGRELPPAIPAAGDSPFVLVRRNGPDWGDFDGISKICPVEGALLLCGQWHGLYVLEDGAFVRKRELEIGLPRNGDVLAVSIVEMAGHWPDSLYLLADSDSDSGFDLVFRQDRGGWKKLALYGHSGGFQFLAWSPRRVLVNRGVGHASSRLERLSETPPWVSTVLSTYPVGTDSDPRIDEREVLPIPDSEGLLFLHVARHSGLSLGRQTVFRWLPAGASAIARADLGDVIVRGAHVRSAEASTVFGSTREGKPWAASVDFARDPPTVSLIPMPAGLERFEVTRFLTLRDGAEWAIVGKYGMGVHDPSYLLRRHSGGSWERVLLATPDRPAPLPVALLQTSADDLWVQAETSSAQWLYRWQPRSATGSVDIAQP